MRIPKTPPPIRKLIEDPEQMHRVVELLARGVGSAPKGKYRHWDVLRHTSPPENVTLEQWWTAIKLARSQTKREVPGFVDKIGRPFHYTMPDPLLEMLHFIDRQASGQIQVPGQIGDPATKDRYIQSSLIEEAITSSQLEGAATTSKIAKEMIRTGRKPATTSERMIYNNYRAMRLLSGLKNDSLSPGLVDEIQRVLIEKNYPDADSYRRKPDDGTAVRSTATGKILHKPPPAEELTLRMQRMCDFANQAKTGAFLHPVLKAIILHFWLAYDHPYTDGNGRTARALFYWSMLSQGFWLFEYVSISAIIRKGPAKYGRSFLYTETDENDLTYFLLAQLRVVQRSIEELDRYLKKKIKEQQETLRLVHGNANFNHRQIAFISHMLKYPNDHYTFKSHSVSHRIAYETARKDLLELAGKGLIIQIKRGKRYSFIPVSDLEERLKDM